MSLFIFAENERIQEPKVYTCQEISCEQNICDVSVYSHRFHPR